MGRDKALLPLLGKTMLERTVRTLGEVCDVVAVVGAEQQQLPELSENVLILRDRHPQRGPLQGLCDGLQALPEDVTSAFVCSCDLPLLKAEFIQEVMQQLGDYEIAAPCDDRGPNPLAAAYRRSVLPTIESLLADGQRRLKDLLAACDTLEISVEKLRPADPSLHSLLNCNTPEDYEKVLQIIRQTARE